MTARRPARGRRSMANTARFWNDRVEAAETDPEKASLWWAAARKVAVQSNDPKVWADLVRTLHDFYRRHTG